MNLKISDIENLILNINWFMNEFIALKIKF